MKWEDIYSGKAYAQVEREEKAARSMNERAIRRKKTQRLEYRGKASTRHFRNNINRKRTSAPRPRAAEVAASAIANQGYLAMFATLSLGLLLFIILGIVPFAKAAEVSQPSFEVSDKAYVENTTIDDEAIAEETSDVVEYAFDDNLVSNNTFDESALQDLTVNDQFLNSVEKETLANSDESVNENSATTASGHDWSQITYRDFEGLSTDEKIELLGAMARDDAADTHILASVTMAQAILESGWMSSSLTTNFENYFGIKASSGGYNWEGSTWSPDDVAVMPTQEEYEAGVITDIEAGFRTYSGTWDSIRDHSAYLLNSGLYPGINEATSPEEAVYIIANGGYATGTAYPQSLLTLIYTYDLTRFDA